MPNISLGIEHLHFHFVDMVESQHTEVLACMLFPEHVGLIILQWLWMGGVLTSVISASKPTNDDFHCET